MAANTGATAVPSPSNAFSTSTEATARLAVEVPARKETRAMPGGSPAA